MSSPLVIIPHSVTDAAALDVTPAAVSGLGADNLQLSDRGLILRVEDDALTITADLSRAARIGGAVLWRHNLGGGATWRLRAYDEPAQAGNEVLDTGNMPAVPAKTLGELDWGIDDFVAAISGIDYSYAMFDPVIAQSLQIDVEDPGTDHIDIARLFVGPTLRPATSYLWGARLRWERQSRRTRTASGGLRVEADERYRVLAVELDWIEQAERSRFAEMLDESGSGREQWVSARTGAGGRMESDHAMLAYLRNDEDLTALPGRRYGLPLEFEES